MRATPRALLRLALLLSCSSAEDRPRHAAAAHCASRGRTLIAFGAHTDEQFVQKELTNIVDAAYLEFYLIVAFSQLIKRRGSFCAEQTPKLPNMQKVTKRR